MAGDRSPVLLIVEDDFELAELLADYFTARGYRVLTTPWGEKAIRQASDEHPDLVVLDIYLPDFDGFEVFRRLQESHRTRDIPVIFLTERGARDDRLHGLSLQAVDYITKPFDIQELRLRVRNALRRATQASLVNPVTNLPEGPSVDDKLGTLMFSESAWAMLLITIMGLDSFRELYGFIASDDVLRAVSLMMNNAVREVGSEADFIGHLAAHDFIIITDDTHLAPIRDRIEVRLKQSMAYFYPLKDRDKAQQAMAENRLKLVIGQINHQQGPFSDLDAVKTAVLKSREVDEDKPLANEDKPPASEDKPPAS